MVEEEEGDDEAEDAGQHVRSGDEERRSVRDVRARECSCKDAVRGEDDPLARDGRVEQQADEVLVVVEADAVVQPRTVMVHLQDASIALAAVVAAIRLCLQTPLAHPNATEALPLDALKNDPSYGFLVHILLRALHKWASGRPKVLKISLHRVSRVLNVLLNVIIHQNARPISVKTYGDLPGLLVGSESFQVERGSVNTRTLAYFVLAALLRRHVPLKRVRNRARRSGHGKGKADKCAQEEVRKDGCLPVSGRHARLESVLRLPELSDANSAIKVTLTYGPKIELH